MKMASDLVAKCPLLLKHRADLGENSSAVFAAKARKGGADGRDLDYLLATSRAA